MSEVARQIAEMITAEFKRRGAVVSSNEVDKAATALAKPGVADIEWTFVNSYHQMVWDDSHNFIRFKAKEIKAEHAAKQTSAVGTPGGVECRVMFRQSVVERSLSDRQLDRIRTMPPLIRAMTQDSNAWVVGSRAEFREGRINIKPTSDWDVIVPYAEWQDVMTRLASAGVLEKAGFSSVGGVRTTIPAKNGSTIGLDIWPGEISHYMMKPFTHVAWQPKTGSVWVRGE